MELDDTRAAEGGRATPVPDTGDADADPRRLGVATQERVRLAVHERVFGAPRDPVRIGRYTVLKRIGQGGMGVVYAAYDTELDRKVALKLLHGDSGDTGERLTREAKALAKLSHPSIVAVHEVGVHDGNVFVAMEFVDGETLREHVERRALDWREIVALYVQAGRGLAAAHAAGLVHRDFKPDNAIVADTPDSDAGSRVRVLDFGLARDVGDREAAHSLGSDAAIDRAVELTRTGTLLGTPAYMAPEQYVGTAVDAYADQFAFCVSLWEAIYRERPFDDTSVATVAAAIMSGRRRPPPAGSKVPLALHRVLERGLELRTLDRFSSMGELVDTLEAIASARRRGRLAVSIVAGVLALGIGGSVWIGREREHSSRADALAGEAAVEHARAEQALQDLADREQAVLLAEAKILLERDPTTAVAKLAQLDPASSQWGKVARVLAADARDRGVARRVIPLPPGREARRWWHDDWIVTADPTRDGEMVLDPSHGTVMPLGAAREHVFPDGRVLLGTLHGLWLVEPGAKRSRRLHEAAFYSDLTTRMVVAKNGEHAALIGEVGDAAIVHVYSFAGGTVRTERFENGTDILALADDGRRMVVYEAGHLFVHGGAREITLVRDTSVGTRAVSSDFRTIAWGMRDASGHDVLVVADTDGKELRRMTVEGLGRNDVELSPDGQRLALRRRGGGLELVDVADGSMRRLASAEIERVRFTADGAYVLAADERRAIHVWRPADGGLRTIHCGLEPMDFTLDVRADRLRVLGRDQVREYQGVVPEARRAIPNDAATAIAADPAARTIVVADRDGAAVIVYRDELAPRRVPVPDGVDTVAVSPDGERFATAGGPRLSLFERDGDLIAEVDDPDAPMRLEFDPDGTRLAWIGHSGTVVVWRFGTREPQLYEPGRLGVYALAFEPGTDRIGVVGWDHIGPLFYMLDPFRGVLGVIPMKVPDDTQPRAIAFSSRKQLAYAAIGKGVFVADARGGPPRRLGGRDVADAFLWFSPDGGQLAAIGGRSGATIWDVDSGASYHPALAGVQPRAGFGTIGADGSFTIVGDQLVTRAVLGLGGDADDVRVWVAGATDLHVDPGPLAFLAE